MTVESSQPAPAQQPAQPAPSAQPKSDNNQAVRIAALVVLGLVAVGVIAYLIWGRDTNKPHHPKVVVQAIGPTAFSAQNLAQESQFINTKFFWAGKRQGYRYEFTRTTDGHLFVRYLPPGVAPGSKPGHFLIVATYPFLGAYQALKDKTKGKAVIAGPNGSLIYVRRNDPKSVLMGFPGSPNDQIEIYAPTKIEAISAARSGAISPVRKK